MGSASVMFLDGPLAGSTREAWAHPDGSPGPVYCALESVGFDSPDWPARTVTYRVKRNRLSYGPQWVGAIGDKVGEQVAAVFPYDQRARHSVGADKFDEYLTRNAYDALQRLAKAEGLVAVEVHEVWRGTRAEAREQMMREGKTPGPDRAIAAADSLGDPASIVFVVHEAVAIPKDQAREVIL
ncbi:hypothetical protein I5H09_gp013 [Mycobacterium phage Yunkel11]|uniref:Uncharacterized protein n=1 Tax=Mycobacterium phage Yunkel11 TaxID=2599886 RepID=A0A5J6TDL6_9CAUD|nr:hypothetical protein I5H09_gp013 [Mycobacterium phage Yunkel11]QFG08478.1 hypothetical protein SEA_YUNKEL11_93 [Mycobacterium phage Yunkel11]